MDKLLQLNRFSLGVGDRFAHQAAAQLAACQKAFERGVLVVPVWNKSNREHTTIGSQPASVRAAAETAVHKRGWTHPYHVDADHINRDTVEPFLATSDFFTIDVADAIGKPADEQHLAEFHRAAKQLAGSLDIPGLSASMHLTDERIREVAAKYLYAVQRAGIIYRHIASVKGPGTFITEVSMDETDQPQTPIELLLILFALAQQQIPLQTIAPKFTGRFNKGVDYVGDLSQFEREFRDDLAVIAFAVKNFSLPPNLKLSVHSGSDKFSLYGIIRRAAEETGAGWHVKTAGTTWLEELIGLAEGGPSGLMLAQDIYREAWKKRDLLQAPYASVIDIDPAKLPVPSDVELWDSCQFADALRHVPNCPAFNPHFRQLLHVGYKVAAQYGVRYLQALDEHRESIARNVTENLWDRHLSPLLFGNT